MRISLILITVVLGVDPPAATKRSDLEAGTKAALIVDRRPQHQSSQLLLRRWSYHSDMLMIKLANHGDHAIHINAISILTGRGIIEWFLIERNVEPGSIITHWHAVREEPACFDLRTSDGELRFDLIPDHH